MGDYKYVIRGAYGDGNFGDDALMLANLNVALSLVKPRDVLILGNKAAYLDKYLKGAGFADWRHACNVRARLLVYGGGTQFFSFQSSTAGAKFKLLFTNPKRGYLALRRKFCPLFKSVGEIASLGVGFGPFVPGSAQEAGFRRDVVKMAWVGVRDGESLALCKGAGRSDVFAGADICWATDLWTTLDPTTLAVEKDGSVAFIPRDWGHSSEGGRFLHPMLMAAKKLADRGVKVKVALFSGKDKKCIALAQRLGLSLVVWDAASGVAEDFLRELAKSSAVVTARFHGAVFSALLKIPTVFVEVEPKLALANKAFGDERCLWGAPFNPDALADMAAANIDAGQSPEVASKVARQKALAVEMVESFKRFASKALAVNPENSP